MVRLNEASVLPPPTIEPLVLECQCKLLSERQRVAFSGIAQFRGAAYTLSACASFDDLRRQAMDAVQATIDVRFAYEPLAEVRLRARVSVYANGAVRAPCEYTLVVPGSGDAASDGAVYDSKLQLVPMDVRAGKCAFALLDGLRKYQQRLTQRRYKQARDVCVTVQPAIGTCAWRMYAGRTHAQVEALRRQSSSSDLEDDFCANDLRFSLFD